MDNQRSRKYYVIACALFASLNAVLAGYNGGVLGGAIKFIHEDLKITKVQEEVLIGCSSIVSLIGSIAGGRSSNGIGRKWTMAIGSIIFQIGGLIMTIAPSFIWIMIGRLLSGIGVGFWATVMTMYIAEISPAASRGFLTSFPEIFVNFGILLGHVSNYIFAGLPKNINWRVMLGIGLLPSLIIIFALIFIVPESPRWLVLRNRVEEARSTLFKTIGDEKEVEERLGEILQAVTQNNDQQTKAVWLELLRPKPMVLKMLITGIGIQCFQQITGTDALVFYSPTIFKSAGMEGNSQLLASIAVPLTKTCFVLVAMYLLDRKGRKPLLYVSTIGMTICLLGTAVSMRFLGYGSLAGVILSILLVCANIAFFSVGIGPICGVLNSEIYPSRLRAQAVALGFVVNRLCSGIICLSFLSFSSAISVPGTFFVFSILSAFAVVFVYKMVPETKGKTLEQIECLFKKTDGCKGHTELANNGLLVS